MRAAHLLVAAWSQALVTDTSPKFYGILEADTDVTVYHNGNELPVVLADVPHNGASGTIGPVVLEHKEVVPGDVIAVHARNKKHGKVVITNGHYDSTYPPTGAFILALGSGAVVTNKKWSCSTVQRDRWTTQSYTERAGQWEPAVEQFAWCCPWRSSTSWKNLLAKYIWSGNADEDKEVFCRYKVGMLDSNYGMDGSPIGSQGAPLLMIKSIANGASTTTVVFNISEPGIAACMAVQQQYLLRPPTPLEVFRAGSEQVVPPRSEVAFAPLRPSPFDDGGYPEECDSVCLDSDVQCKMDCALTPCVLGSPAACDRSVEFCYERCDEQAASCRIGCSAVNNCSKTESCEAIAISHNYTVYTTESDSLDELFYIATQSRAIWAGYKSPALPQHELLIKIGLTPGKTFEVFCATKSYSLDEGEVERISSYPEVQLTRREFLAAGCFNCVDEPAPEVTVHAGWVSIREIGFHVSLAHRGSVGCAAMDEDQPEFLDPDAFLYATSWTSADALERVTVVMSGLKTHTKYRVWCTTRDIIKTIGTPEQVKRTERFFITSREFGPQLGIRVRDPKLPAINSPGPTVYSATSGFVWCTAFPHPGMEDEVAAKAKTTAVATNLTVLDSSGRNVTIPVLTVISASAIQNRAKTQMTVNGQSWTDYDRRFAPVEEEIWCTSGEFEVVVGDSFQASLTWPHLQPYCRRLHGFEQYAQIAIELRVDRPANLTCVIAPWDDGDRPQPFLMKPANGDTPENYAMPQEGWLHTTLSSGRTFELFWPDSMYGMTYDIFCWAEMILPPGVVMQPSYQTPPEAVHAQRITCSTAGPRIRDALNCARAPCNLRVEVVNPRPPDFQDYYGLQYRDSFMAMLPGTCGKLDAAFPAFPFEVRRVLNETSGLLVSYHSLPTTESLPYPGEFVLCWCPGWDPSSKNYRQNKPGACTRQKHFFEVGRLSIAGGRAPTEVLFCTRGRQCLIRPDVHASVEGDYIDVRPEADLGSRLPPLHFAFADVTGRTWDLGRVAHLHGRYALSWCRPPCTREQTVVVGYITVQGPEPHQVFVCQFGSYCTINLEGTELRQGDYLELRSPDYEYRAGAVKTSLRLAVSTGYFRWGRLDAPSGVPEIYWKSAMGESTYVLAGKMKSQGAYLSEEQQPIADPQCMLGLPCIVKLYGEGLWLNHYFMVSPDCMAESPTVADGSFLVQGKARAEASEDDSSPARYRLDIVEALPGERRQLCICFDDCMSDSATYSFAAELHVIGPRADIACLPDYEDCPASVAGELRSEDDKVRVAMSCGSKGDGLYPTILAGQRTGPQEFILKRVDGSPPVQAGNYKLCWSTLNVHDVEIGAALLVGPKSAGHYICYDHFPCEITLFFFGGDRMKGSMYLVGVHTSRGCGETIRELNESGVAGKPTGFKETHDATKLLLPLRRGRFAYDWPTLALGLREDPLTVQLCWAADFENTPTQEAGGIEVWPGNKNPEANYVAPAFLDPATTALSIGLVAILVAGTLCGLKPRQFDTDGQPIEEPVLTDTKPANPRWITAQLISHLNGRRTLARLAKEEEQPELQDDEDIPRFKPYEPVDEVSLHEKVTMRPVPSRDNASPMYITERSQSSRVRFLDGGEQRTEKRTHVISPSHRDAQRAADRMQDAMFMLEQRPPPPALPSGIKLPEHLAQRPGVPELPFSPGGGGLPDQLSRQAPRRDPSPHGGLPGSVGFGSDGVSFGDTQNSFRDTHDSFYRVSRTTTFSGSQGEFRETRESAFSSTDREMRAERSVRQQRVARTASSPPRRAGSRGAQPALFPDEVV